MGKALFAMFIFPGCLFVSIFALMAEFIDRKLYAKMQNRIGPPWYQTFADFIKLLGKEDIIPAEANARMFSLAPLFALTAAITAFLYIPLGVSGVSTLFSFNGDVIVVLYLLTLPTLAIFVGGWYSSSLYARLGTMRSLTQLFGYEVPLFTGILSSALLANSWSLVDIANFYSQHSWYWIFNILGGVVSMVALLAKLQKTPFDIPEAETEIVAGGFVEYSGRLYALLRLTIDVEMVAGSALLVAVFFPFGMALPPVLGFIWFMVKTLCVIIFLALLHTVLQVAY